LFPFGEVGEIERPVDGAVLSILNVSESAAEFPAKS
jgi:hypothetical protein